MSVRRCLTEDNETGLPGYAGTRHAKTYTMTVPDGTYSLSDLEEYIARELWCITDGSRTAV
jgi:hypothetical protein